MKSISPPAAKITEAPPPLPAVADALAAGTDEWSVPARMLAALIGLTLFVVLWSVLASTTFLAGTRMLMTHKGVPLLDFWNYERFYGFANPVVGKWLKISAAVATAVPALMFALRVARSGLPGTKPLKLHGGTRWATRRELARRGSLREVFRSLCRQGYERALPALRWARARRLLRADAIGQGRRPRDPQLPVVRSVARLP